MAGNPTLPTENINEVILRLLALEPNEIDEIDYQTYNSYLKELLIQIDIGKKIDSGETELIRNEFKRIRGKKGRFRIKKAKITATGLGLGGIRSQFKATQKRLMLAPVGGVLGQTKGAIEKISTKEDNNLNVLSRISGLLDSIISTLTNVNSENKKRVEGERRDAESRRRSGREKDLESQRFDGIKNALSAITKPFQSIWDRIVNFITTIVLGRIILKLIDWFADPNNQEKIQSIIRFFKDHWPTLLALYLRFGTGIGRIVGKLGGILIKGAIRLGALAAKLAAKAGLKGFGKVASFLGGPRGKVLGTALSIGADVAITAGTAAGIGGLASGDLKVPGFSGGGFSGGIKNFFGNMFSGLVNGPKGRDKVPAMLTDGEFVMSAGAVQKYGVDTLESMNAAGGGTNVPQIADGVTFAQGGGMIGDAPQDDKKERIKDPILEKRKKIIASQLQAQKALSSGSGLNIKGASTGRQLGTGYGAKYQGREAIVIKGGSANMDLSVNVAGKQYYGMKRGDDAIYSALDRRDRGAGNGGFLQPGGLFGGPRMSARMDYAAAKGKYYSSSDRKTYGNYNDAMAAKKSRMTSLASQQRLNKLSSAGANRSSRGVRFDAEDKARGQEVKNRGGTWGQISRGWMNAFGSEKDRQNIAAQDKASLARVKQSGAASIGRYYSSSDGKYYANYATADKARLARKQTLKSGVKPLPKPKPKYNPSGGGMGGGRGSGSSPSAPSKAPKFSPTHKKGTKTAQATLGVRK